MNPFDKILKGNNQQTYSTTSKGSYDDILSDFNSAKSTPTKTNTAFNFVKEVAKGMAKLPLRAATNIDQGLSGTNREIYSGKTFGDVKSIGTRSFDFGMTPENFKKDMLDIGGAGLEAASYLGFGPSAKAGFTATTQLAKGATKKAGQTLLRSAGEGAFGGLTGNVGQQMQDNAATGKAFNPMETLKATAGGAVLAPAINIFSRGVGKAFGKGAKEIEEEVFVAPKLTKEESYQKYLNEQGYEGYANPNQLPEIKMGAKGKPATPTIEYGKTNPNIITPDTTLPTSKTQIPTANMINSPQDVDKVLGSIINNGKKAPELAEQVVKQSSPIVDNVAPTKLSFEDFDMASKIVDDMPNMKDVPEFERQTNIEQVASIMKRPQEEIIDIVKSGNVPDNIPIDAYYSVAKNIADDLSKQGDSSLAIDLLPYKREISSKSGQKLQATKITNPDNIVDVLDEVQTAKFGQLSKGAKLRYDADLEEAVQIVRKEFDKLKGLPTTREQIVATLSKLIC